LLPLSARACSPPRRFSAQARSPSPSPSRASTPASVPSARGSRRGSTLSDSRGPRARSPKPPIRRRTPSLAPLDRDKPNPPTSAPGSPPAPVP